jgi:hypothetical protein
MIGISKSSLWSAWKSIRLELRKASIRDVVDYLDYDIDPDVWINRLRNKVSDGRYEPSVPLRFTLGKSNGFSRTMTFPCVPDLVLYRAITDAVHRKARRYQQPHVYFLRDQVSSAERLAVEEARKLVDQVNADYRMKSESSFLNWLRFDQYRRLLLLKRVYPYIVLTDITNFFDSILHAQVEAALMRIKTPHKLAGLLFFLLERLAVRHPYGDSPRIGLPVDEFDCSRTLAHVVLFSHDERMVKITGSGGYVRWMDDQNMGAPSRSKGLRILSHVQKSLAQLHLTPNAKKSRVLSLSEARRYFHFEANRLLDALEEKIKHGVTSRRALQRELRRTYTNSLKHEDHGEWEKVLRRTYRLAGLLRVRLLRLRAMRDILSAPTLADRVCDYVRCCSTTAEYLDFIFRLVDHAEQIYPDVNLVALESLLRVEATGNDARAIRHLASNILRGGSSRWKGTVFGGPAVLLILRFGDGRSLPLLRTAVIKAERGYAAEHDARATAIVYSSFGASQFTFVRRVAARQMRNPLAAVVRVIEAIRAYREVPNRYKNRLRLSYDSVSDAKFIDMRILLMARLLSLSKNKSVRNWATQWARNRRAESVSRFDKLMIRRLLLG